MAKFRFRMATLLRLREATRDQRRAELAEAYRVDDMLKQQQQSLADEFARHRDEMRRVAGPGTVNVDRLIDAQRYELMIKAQEKQLARQRESVAQEIERRRELLVEATREVRSFELLRERQWQKHQDEENRRDIKRLDEVAQVRAARTEALS